MIIDAAVAAKTKLIVWSGLEDFTAISNGKYGNVEHFDGKAAVTAYGKSLGVPFVNVEAGMYMSNFITMGAPKNLGNGTFAMFGPNPPESLTSLIDIEHDYGRFVREAIESYQADGTLQEILGNGDVISFGDIAKEVAEGEFCRLSVMQFGLS